MTATNPAAPVPYISTISVVCEVALSGTADLAYWHDRLRREGLRPHADDGRASLLITAISSKFRGIPFHELSFSVLVSDGGAMPTGAYLAHAYNSSRLLGFAERVFFRTPYYPADLALNDKIPAWMTAAADGRECFSARMGAERAAIRCEAVVFEGPIYLPGGRHVFFARLSGAGDIYAFDSADTIAIGPDSTDDIFARLLESDFTGKQWLVRAGAVHARSRTFDREKWRAES